MYSKIIVKFWTIARGIFQLTAVPELVLSCFGLGLEPGLRTFYNNAMHKSFPAIAIASLVTLQSCMPPVHAAKRDYTNELQLVPGLSITFRVWKGIDTRMKKLGDYEFRIQVEEASKDGYKYNWEMEPPAPAAGTRTVSGNDEKSAHNVSLFYVDKQRCTILGSTNIVRVSDALYKGLKSGEPTPFGLDGPEGGMTPEGGKMQIELPRTLQAEKNELMYVWINDKRVSVKSIKAKTDNGWNYWILDNPRFPIMLAGDGPFYWGEPKFNGVDSEAKDLTKQLEQGGIATSYHILFAFDSDQLTEHSKDILRAVGKYLADKPNMRVLIEGHTDNKGGLDYNLNLSQRRAASVERFLTQESGISADRLESAGRGYSEPVESNETAEGRAKNRRVVFKRI